MAITFMETQGWTYSRAEQEVIDIVRRSLRQIFELVARDDITTDAAARQIAQERLLGASEGAG
jgi:glutamate dehydrogenase/leucine dehydrogenase